MNVNSHVLYNQVIDAVKRMEIETEKIVFETTFNCT